MNLAPQKGTLPPSHDAGRQAPARILLIMGSAGVRIWTTDDSLRHRYPDDVVHKYVPAASLACEPATADVGRELTAGELLNGKRIAEVMNEDGGCWTPCSGCQEGVDGYVSTKDYPYSATFKCQPGGGCRECGGIGVLWQDGAFLASYSDDLSIQQPNKQADGSWTQHAADFDAMSDEEIERESDDCRNQLDELESWLEAVASWEAAGKPRFVTPTDQVKEPRQGDDRHE